MRRDPDSDESTSYQTYDDDGMPIKRVDLVGRAHGGIRTPHVVEFERHANPRTGEVFVRPKRTTAGTWGDALRGKRPEPTKLPAVGRQASPNGEQPGVWDYLGEQNGAASLAVAFSYLFWPSFVEVEGCVLLEERYEPSNFREWWERLSGDVPRVEEVINHVHLWDLFYGDDGWLPDGALAELARVMAHCWMCALREAYPSRSFDVRLSTGDADYGPTVSFSSVADRLAD